MRKHWLMAPLALACLGACTKGVPTVEDEVAEATRLAGEDFAESLFICDPKSTKIADMLAEGVEQLGPTWAFDNLAFLGNSFVGVWVLNTSDGLILFDAGIGEADARDNIVPGIKKLGLDPEDIRYVFVTHGHWDHYGGAAYLKQISGAQIGLGEADWELMARLEPGSLARAPYFGDDLADRPPPERDLVVADGTKIKLGDSEVTLLITPGHSPGTLSALIPVRQGDKTHVMSLLGGTAFPRSLEPTGFMGGLRQFEASVERLRQISQEAGADGTINTHPFVDGTTRKLGEIAAAGEEAGAANPFVLGSDKVSRYYSMFLSCLRAAALRPMGAIELPPMPSSPEEKGKE
ncbi:MAG: MBL fold metallo-hydrolase [Novosphingobium sp.]|nr:MBL fold metallo-hydrolase [Novosphingobium sp.]